MNFVDELTSSMVGGFEGVLFDSYNKKEVKRNKKKGDK